MLSATYVEALRDIGLAGGLDAVGVASAEPFDDERAILVERARAGLSATMAFTYRNPGRSTDPSATLPGAASLVVGARRYAHRRPEAPPGSINGRVAHYATADHYAALRAGLEQVAERLRVDGWTARILVDDNALMDRAAARRAGLGWYGKNANVLVPGVGSWVVLGSVLTDAPLPPATDVPDDGCGACTRCLRGCPTGAIVAPGVVDARRCLAWLVQAEGVFPPEHRAALGDRLYGCDECQEVCPPSQVHPASHPASHQPAHRSGASAGPVAVADPVVRRSSSQPSQAPQARPGPGPWVDVLELLGADDDELLARYGRWYIPRRQARYLRRNALVVLGNSGRGDDPGVRAALDRALVDPDPLVRAHAVWAARRLGLGARLDQLAALDLLDRHPWVRAELARPAPDPVGAAGSRR